MRPFTTRRHRSLFVFAISVLEPRDENLEGVAGHLYGLEVDQNLA